MCLKPDISCRKSSFRCIFFEITGGLIFRQRFVVSNRNDKGKLGPNFQLGRENWIDSRSTPVGGATLYTGVPEEDRSEGDVVVGQELGDCLFGFFA